MISKFNCGFRIEQAASLSGIKVCKSIRSPRDAVFKANLTHGEAFCLQYSSFIQLRFSLESNKKPNIRFILWIDLDSRSFVRNLPARGC